MEWQKFERAEKDTVIPALICIVDELAEFIGDSSTRDRKKRDLMDRFDTALQQIARLGRAAHIHLLLATQTPSVNLFGADLKSNLGQRFICGYVDANISRMAIDSESGNALPSDKPGMYLGWVGGKEQIFQGYFTKQSEVLACGTAQTDEEIAAEEAESERIAQEIEQMKNSLNGEGNDVDTKENDGDSESETPSESSMSSFMPMAETPKPPETPISGPFTMDSFSTSAETTSTETPETNVSETETPQFATSAETPPMPTIKINLGGIKPAESSSETTETPRRAHRKVVM